MPKRRATIIAAILASVPVLFLAATRVPYAVADYQLAEAKVRWSERNFTAYQITVRCEGALCGCQTEAEVVNEAVVSRTNANGIPCINDGGLTVSALFRNVESTNTQALCGPNGCGCDGRIGAIATYDALRGYPVKIEHRLVRELRWTLPEYWLHELRGYGCTFAGFVGNTLHISLTPRQQ